MIYKSSASWHNVWTFQNFLEWASLLSTSSTRYVPLYRAMVHISRLTSWIWTYIIVNMPTAQLLHCVCSLTLHLSVLAGRQHSKSRWHPCWFCGGTDSFTTKIILSPSSLLVFIECFMHVTCLCFFVYLLCFFISPHTVWRRQTPIWWGRHSAVPDSPRMTTVRCFQISLRSSGTKSGTQRDGFPTNNA